MNKVYVRTLLFISTWLSQTVTIQAYTCACTYRSFKMYVYILYSYFKYLLHLGQHYSLLEIQFDIARNSSEGEMCQVTKEPPAFDRVKRFYPIAKSRKLKKKSEHELTLLQRGEVSMNFGYMVKDATGSCELELKD